MPDPARAARGSTSAKTPMGARRMIQRTMRSIASLTARKKPRSVDRACSSLRAMAIANSKVKRISCSIAPLAAAAMGLVGMSDVSHAPTVCAWPGADSWLAASTAPAGRAGRAPLVAGDSWNNSRSSGTATMASVALNATNTSRVSPPSRPTVFTSLADATPVISSETTSGMTVIRIAFTQIVPIGARASAADRSGALPLAPMITPATTATPSETRTRVLSFMNVLSGGSSQHQIAAVDVERCPREIAGLLGRREADEIRNLQRRTEPWYGIAGGKTLEQLGRRILVRQLGVDHTRTDRVYRNAEFAELLGGGAGESEQPRLGRRVVRAAQRADHAAGRGRDVDDASVSLRPHGRQHGLREQERRRHVHLEGETPFVGAELGETR